MKQVVTFGLIVLVASMILGGIPSAEASSDSNVLLRLVQKAQTQIEQQMKNNDSPKVEELYVEGLAHVKFLEEAIDKEDVDSSRKHFLTAMRIFKQIAHLSSDIPTAEATDKAEAKLEAAQAAPQHDYSSDLERLFKYVTSIKSVSRTHGADIDFNPLDNLFSTARNQILNENYGEAEDTIDKIKHTVLDINKTIREYANKKAEDRAQNYANQYMEKVDRLIAQAEKAKLSDEIINELKDAKEKLATASSTREVIQEIRKIISIEQKFDLTKANQLESRVMQLEKMLERLSQVDGIDESKFSDAIDKLEKIKHLISDGELDDANIELRSLYNEIKDLQNSDS